MKEQKNESDKIAPTTTDESLISDLESFREQRQKTDIMYIELIIKLQPQHVNQVDNAGRIPLHLAAEQGKAHIAKVLIKHSPQSIYFADSDGCTPLHLATVPGHQEVVKLLLENDPKLIYCTNNEGLTALHLAIIYGHKNLLELFFQYDPESANYIDNEGNNLLQLALAHRNNFIENYNTDKKKLHENFEHKNELAATEIEDNVPAEASLSLSDLSLHVVQESNADVQDPAVNPEAEVLGTCDLD